ncbi:MAG: tRNA dihydrouridine synthase DusB [Fluviicoccus sp.]|uniref:tRNA dihydrouridine synthase DusB n=1 Tax=Fluviicoccus sp. TaxID=2003552 RepID=UPI002724DEBA|nr:tRNA dihydrouridine synthase DusB [Fluviicoccus sp.]MDO8331723.1 tRNA dihydrouridine synthase DusB [Fluviicoccus sp.]
MLSPIAIGPYRIDPIALAPMAGVTDRPFRKICRDLGAGYTVSEMVTSDARLWNTAKSSFRLNHDGEPGPRSVQILGYDPAMMAEAARLNVERGAQIIDINMGCPAKKVCNRLAGSALMQDEALVADILNAVVKAVDVPVTLKTRTGWNRDNRNGVNIARIAEDAGIRMLVIHGRTRADKYEGDAEYDTVAAIKQAVGIPVLANGDINSPEKALTVLQQTGCDGIMLGRAAHGRPWIFREIRHFLSTRILLSPPDLSDQIQVSLNHVAALHDFYGEELGVRFARKHIGWYAQYWEHGRDFVRRFHALTTGEAQRAAVQTFQASCLEGFPVIS